MVSAILFWEICESRLKENLVQGRRTMKYLSDRTKDNILSFLLFGIIATLFLLIFGWQTSPLHSFREGDSTVFILLGQLTKKGMIPYKDFFDHKGPFIYFVEYLGAVISDGTIGIFCIQILFMTVSLMGIYKISRLYISSTKGKVMTVCSLLVINLYLQGGNCTEEFCLPFLVWSTYYAIRYFKFDYVNGREHNPIYSGVYGVTFMVCAFTRVTNAIPLCMILIAGIFTLAYNKKWKNIFKNIMAFLLGTAIFAIPFIIYYISKDAMYEMIYGTIIYNIRYATENAKTTSMLETFNYMKYCLAPIIGQIIISFLLLINKTKKSMEYILFLIMGTIAVFMEIKGMPWQHYLMIWVPGLIWFILEYCTELKQDSLIIKRYTTIIAIFCVVIVGGKNLSITHDAYVVYNDTDAENFKSEVSDIIKFIPQEDRDSVIAYNVKPIFYTFSDISPCFRFFISQDWQCIHDKGMFNEFRQDIASKKAKYIVANKNEGRKLDDLISANYEEVHSLESLTLFKAKN